MNGGALAAEHGFQAAHKPLSELLDHERSSKYVVQSTAYSDAYTTPVLTAGKTFILGYTDETDGVYPASPDKPVVIFDDFTTAFKYVDFSFKVKSSAIRILTPKPGIAVDLRYVYYAMSCIRFAPQEHATHWIRTYSKFAIPVPPPAVQRQIVELLDRFTELTADLENTVDAEAVARRTQHDWARRKVLRRQDPVSIGPSAVLSDVVEFMNGKPQERLVSEEGTVVLLTARFISTSGRAARWVRSEDALTPARSGDVAMVMSDLPNGRALARCFYVEEDGRYSANQRVCLLRVRDEQVMMPCYLCHVLDRNPQLLAFDNGHDQTHLKKSQILGIHVPLIPIADQERAVSILNELEVGMRDLIGDLGLERATRRRQYEHYRDRLLTFTEAA